MSVAVVRRGPYASWTVVGDLAQRARDAAPRTWEEVGTLIGQSGFGQFQETLQDGGAVDHLSADSDSRCLGSGGERRYVHTQVTPGSRLARQPPTGGHLLFGERASVHASGRYLTLEDLHAALAASAVTTAG